MKFRIRYINIVILFDTSKGEAGVIHFRDDLAGYIGLMEGTGALTRNRIYPIFLGPDYRVGKPGSRPGCQPIRDAETLME